MKPRDAIDTLERFQSNKKVTKKLDDAIKMAIIALEKEEPTKPNYVWINAIARFSCPNCGCSVLDFSERCDCGQLMDWSEWK